MKILFVINQLFRGGAETALVNLLSALSDGKYQIDLMIYDNIDLPDAISLIPLVPSYVNVFDVAAGEGKIAYAKKLLFKLYNKLTKRSAFRRNAYKILKDKKYDVAISYGEWFSSSLVANCARADRKYVWVHADADKADFFHPDIEAYNAAYDGFIFASENSMKAAGERYSFFRGRSCVVNNMINSEDILARSSCESELTLPDDDLPKLLTVANVRPEKNHLRQLRVMRRLFDKGLRFYWINIGSQANTSLMEKIKSESRALGLDEYCLFTGASDNPYAVMRRSDAVCVLSDHESWSLVITEAKALGIPVIATKTSGATEQITDGVDGVLCDFSDEDIADKIEEFLENPDKARAIRNNLRGFSSSKNTLSQMERVLEYKKKILYVFDDINYLSGARAAALAQMERLSETSSVTLFSVTAPKDAKLPVKYEIIDIEDNLRFKCLSVPIKTVMSDKSYPLGVKLLRIVYAISVRLGADIPLYNRLLNKTLYRRFNKFDAVCVVSEASKLRHFVSRLTAPKKIQWIHTDYVAWRKHSFWTEKITARDEKTYGNYDAVVCLSDRLADKFSKLYPSFAEKVKVVPNFIDYKAIRARAEEEIDFSPDSAKLNIITVGRMESEKRYDLILKTAQRIKLMGVEFCWYLVGDGVLYESLAEESRALGLEGFVVFTGYMKNPAPLMKKCNLFVLMSEYEGTPVTIDEAAALGVPTLACEVGGIADQLKISSRGEALPSVRAEDIVGFDFEKIGVMSDSEFEQYNDNVYESLKSIFDR